MSSDMHGLPINVENVAPFVAVVGEWNLTGLEVRSLRFHASHIGSGVLEIDFWLGNRVREVATRTEQVEFVFRFDESEGIYLEDFAGFVVETWEFTPKQIPRTGETFMEVRLGGPEGEELNFLCRTVRLLEARPVPTPQ